MEIIIGKNSGFCFGVNNAVEKTKKKLKELANEKQVYCLGEIVHNQQVTKELENMGLIVKDDINDIPNNSICIVRAHGVPPKVYEEAINKKIELIDLTCPKVKLVHKLAEEYKNKNYFVIIIAKKSHPETIGTKGFAGHNSIVVENNDDINLVKQKIKQTGINNIIILSQTTFSVEKFNNLSNMIKERLEDVNLEIKSCICNSTDIRQNEVIELSRKVDLMIIVGGKNSSNTEKLFEIANKEAPKSIWIQTKDDINTDYIKQFNKIGIISGASTPNEIVREIANKCNI